MNVLSLFDGISCGQLALERAGIKVENYFASEIDEYAIKITQKNFPNTIQLGDVTKWYEWDLPKIDLLIGGSPCQGLSRAKNNRQNLNDPRSKLFFEYVRIKDWLIKNNNPNLLFLLENVKPDKETVEIMNEHIGCEPIEIDSALVSAQRRKRLYWTNIPNIAQLEDKGIYLKDIIHENIDFSVRKFNRKNGIGKELNKAITLCSSDWRGLNRNQDQNAVVIELGEYIVPFEKVLQILEREVQRGKIKHLYSDSLLKKSFYIHNKKGLLSSDIDTIESEEYLFGCLTPNRVKHRQEGQRFNNWQKFYILTAQDRHGILTKGYIRRLTPVECERLQTLPDNYTEGVSNTQRYKQLGNGWTVDVIAHILTGIKEIS